MYSFQQAGMQIEFPLQLCPVRAIFLLLFPVTLTPKPRIHCTEPYMMPNPTDSLSKHLRFCFFEASELARKLGLPRIYVSCNSGRETQLRTRVRIWGWGFGAWLPGVVSCMVQCFELRIGFQRSD